MRQGLDTRRISEVICSQFVHTVPNIGGQIIVVLKLLEFDGQHCKTLVDVVVKLSRYTGAFLLLRFNQLPSYAPTAPLLPACAR